MAVICRKQSAFDMQFDLIVVTISLKMGVKDRRDRSSRLLERKDLIIMYRSALLASGLLIFRSTLTNWPIIFKLLRVIF